MITFKYNPNDTSERSNRIHVRGEAVHDGTTVCFFTALIAFYKDIDEDEAIALIMKDSLEWKENLSRFREGEVSVCNVEFRLATATHAPWCPIEIKL